jgi:uncharacterized membrane protein YfcA
VGVPRADGADGDAVEEAVSHDVIIPAVLVGVIGGLMVGLTGIGAGTIVSTLLLLAYPGVEPRVIIGSATIQAVAMKLAGVLARRRFRLRETRIGLAMAAGAAPLGVAGALTSHYVPGGALKAVLAWVLVAVGVMLVVQAAVRRWGVGADTGAEGGRAAGPADPDTTAAPAVSAAHANPVSPAWTSAAGASDPSLWRVGLSGSLVGYFAGLTSIGTGTLFVSMLAGPLRVSAHRAVAAAILAGLVTLMVSGATHAALGHASSAIVAGACIGSVPAVIIGTGLSHRMRGRALRGAIGVAIVVAAVVTLARAGR